MRVPLIVVLFGLPKFVVSVYKNGQYRLQRFQLPEKTPAPSAQPSDIMPQISIRAFYRVRIAFIPNVAAVLPYKIHIKVYRAPIGKIVFSIGSRIDYVLNALRFNGTACLKTYDLARESAHHRHDIQVYPLFLPPAA